MTPFCAPYITYQLGIQFDKKFTQSLAIQIALLLFRDDEHVTRLTSKIFLFILLVISFFGTLYN